MYVGSLPPATIYSTWAESLEVWDVDADALADLTLVAEIVLRLRHQKSGIDDLTLKMSTGEITIPTTGVIEWRAEVGQMGGLWQSNYDVIMTLEAADGTVITLILGSLSVLE